MEQLSRRSQAFGAAVGQSNLGPVFRFIVRFPDLLLVPWILDTLPLYVYIYARFTSLLIRLPLWGLDHKVIEQLKFLSHSNMFTPFQQAAARVNLGYLMISGAMAVLVLSFAPNAIFDEAVIRSEQRRTLLWLVLGQSAPIAFGATGLLMKVVERSTFHDLLRGITAFLFCFSVMMLGAESAVSVAQTFAVSQLTLAAICALLLTQSGVWPGVTALFQKDIRLF